MAVSDYFNPLIIHRPFNFLGKDLSEIKHLTLSEKETWISRQSASYISLSSLRECILDFYLLGGWHFKENRNQIISGENEGKQEKLLEANSWLDNIYVGFFFQLLMNILAIIAIMLLPVNLAKLIISPVTVLPYFLYKHGFLKGLKKTGHYIINQLDALAASLIGIVTIATVNPILTIFTFIPFSRWIAPRRLKKYNQNHPLVQAILDLVAQDDVDDIQQAIDGLIRTEEFSPEQKDKYLYRLTQKIMRDNPAATNTLTGLINHPSAFKAAVDDNLSNNNGIYRTNEYIIDHADALLDRLPRENVLQEAYPILRYYSIFHHNNWDKFENLVDHILLNHKQLAFMPCKHERQRILHSLVNYNMIALKSLYGDGDCVKSDATIDKPLQILLDLLNIPEFLDTFRTSSANYMVKFVLLLKTRSFIEEINLVDLSISNIAETGCYVLQELIKKSNGTYSGSNDIGWLLADIRCLLEKKEIRYQLLNGNDVSGKNYLESLLAIIEQKDTTIQKSLLFPLMEHADISTKLIASNPGHSTLQKIAARAQDAATRGIKSGPTKRASAGHSLSPRMFKPSANVEEAADSPGDSYENTLTAHV